MITILSNLLIAFYGGLMSVRKSFCGKDSEEQCRSCWPCNAVRSPHRRTISQSRKSSSRRSVEAWRHASWLLVVGILALDISGNANAEKLITDEELVLRMGDVSANKFPFIFAYDQKLYEKHGIRVTPKFSPGSVATIRKSGIEVAPENIYDPESKEPQRIAVSGSGPTIVGIATRVGRAPGPLILASTHTKSRWRIITRGDITRPEQLKGKRLGYSGYGAVSHNQWLQFADRMGWDPEFDVALMAGGLGTEALLEGKIDAMIGPELHATMALMQGLEAPIDLTDYNFPTAGSAWVVDREWYKDNKDAAKAFVKVGIEAIAMLKQDRKKAEQTMIHWYGIDDPKARDLFYAELQKLESPPYPPYQGIKMIMHYYDSMEMRRYTPEFFYDDSIVRELDESGWIGSLYN